MNHPYEPAPTLTDAHAQWHSINGRHTVCPLDCGITESLLDEMEEAGPPLVRCGHCGDRHTIAGVRACARTHG